MVFNWTLSGDCNKLELNIYPIDFYDYELIESLTLTGDEYSSFLKSINNEPQTHKKVSFISFYKIKKFYKIFLLEMINGSIYNECDKYFYYHLGLKTVSFTDNQISKLKKELIPLLEKLEKKARFSFEQTLDLNIYERNVGVRIL